MFLVFPLLLVILTSIQGFSECLPEDVIAGQYLVRLKKTVKVGDFKQTLVSKGASFKTITESAPIFSAKGLRPSEVDHLRADPAIDSVESDCRIRLESFAATNDPLLSQQWGLNKINAPSSWNQGSALAKVIVAVSDTGVDYLHEDLKDNMWINPGEISGNDIDDDHNGCVDDIHGCDLADRTGDPMPPNDPYFDHGTHVAGLIAAVGNNGKGIAGTATNVKIMAVKGFSSQGGGYADLSVLLETVYYAVNNGARIINCSWGRPGTPLKAEQDAFRYAYDHGVTVVVAAGNQSLDASGFSPGALPTVITVAATDKSDQLATFSNWGTRIDLAAPGGKGYDSSNNMLDPIISTIPRSSGNYGSFIGTSMASPFVAGLAALVLGINPNLTPSDVLKILADSADSIHVSTPDGRRQFDFRRINALNAVTVARTYVASSSSRQSLSLPSSQGPAGQGGGCGYIQTTRSPSASKTSFLLALFFLLTPIGLSLRLKSLRLFRTN